MSLPTFLTEKNPSLRRLLAGGLPDALVELLLEGGSVGRVGEPGGEAKKIEIKYFFAVRILKRQSSTFPATSQKK